MARFAGIVGFAADEQVETSPDVWVDEIIERSYLGDVVRNTRQLGNGDKVNDDISVRNSISIVADAYASENFLAIRYVRWMGQLWKVDDVEVQSPRLLLGLGERYNGVTS